MSLEQISYRLKSIRTPSLIFPSYLNPPIPRYKPQPLSTSMIMVHRQQARDRRIIQGRAWQEMLKHLKSEAEFDRSLGIVNENQPCKHVPYNYVSRKLFQRGIVAEAATLNAEVSLIQLIMSRTLYAQSEHQTMPTLHAQR